MDKRRCVFFDSKFKNQLEFTRRPTGGVDLLCGGNVIECFCNRVADHAENSTEWNAGGNSYAY